MAEPMFSVKELDAREEQDAFLLIRSGRRNTRVARADDSSVVSQASAPPRLLDQVRNALRVRHRSPRTEEAYLHWIRRFIRFHGKRHPRELGRTEISQFLNHLAVELRISPDVITHSALT